MSNSDKLDQASQLLEDARRMSKDLKTSMFYFDDLGYGAGAALINGEWIPSTSNC